ncbi:S-adenosylmethionine-dependent methyltransferase-like protein [Haloferax mucosum ATCC BAA-1512]|uniref:S-adenosylmethionine-dependent methyltransferase-like protein n=1 Tax=Haloferax mucosum ATCC BAA-1512 TaxID=662479 RepID=M0ITC1_9EURY|nr:class I SAM-dependent methyltransferase [Haloferax mucosum]ELZ99033.1 S-adenosylmethionine-dependent methyltransferase-like protein [Haloferax mucosum ATCC BAA-1512]
MERFQNTNLPDWDWWGKLWPAPGETLRELGVAAGDRLVEIGSGDGYFALPAARIVAPAPVYALDLDASLLADLEQLADQQELGNVVTKHGDARSLSEHVPEPVDVALIANAFHGIEDREAFVTEAASVLADGGRLVVVNWRAIPREATAIDGEPRGPPTDLRLTPAETNAAVESAIGATECTQFDLPPYHYGLVFEPSR